MVRNTPKRIKIITITITSGNSSGSALHGMGTTPTAGYFNPDRVDTPKGKTRTDSTTLYVELEAPVNEDTIFKVACFT